MRSVRKMFATAVANCVSLEIWNICHISGSQLFFFFFFVTMAGFFKKLIGSSLR